MRRLAFRLLRALTWVLIAQGVWAAPPILPLPQDGLSRMPRQCRAPLPNVATPGQGLGGTGQPAQTLANGGLGGTGIDGSGLGGTGAPASKLANGGLGGTGAPAAASVVAETNGGGMGGTGSPALPRVAMRQGEGGDGNGNGGIGGTGVHAVQGGPDGGLGGTGAPASVAQGGTRVPMPSPGPGPDRDGLGGTGIRAAGWVGDITGALLVTDVAGRSLMLGKGNAICPGDRLETGEQTTARLNFYDGTALFLRAQTRLRLEAYVWSEFSPQQGQMHLVLAEGGLRSVSGRLTKGNPQGYLLRAPDVDISVLGTDYEVVHVKVATPENVAGTYAAVASGRIRLDSPSGAMLLKAGEAAVVKLHQAPQRLRSKPTCLICR